MACAGGVGVSAWCVRSGVGSLRRSVRLAMVTPFIHVLLGRPPVFGALCAHSLGTTQEGSWWRGVVLIASDWSALPPKEEPLQGLASAPLSLASCCIPTAHLLAPFSPPSPGFCFCSVVCHPHFLFSVLSLSSSSCSDPPQELSLTLLFLSPPLNPSASPLSPKAA